MTVFKGVPPELQAKLTKRPNILTGASGFAYNIAQRLELEEVEVSERDKDKKLQARYNEWSEGIKREYGSISASAFPSHLIASRPPAR